MSGWRKSDERKQMRRRVVQGSKEKTYEENTTDMKTRMRRKWWKERWGEEENKRMNRRQEAEARGAGKMHDEKSRMEKKRDEQTKSDTEERWEEKNMKRRGWEEGVTDEKKSEEKIREREEGSPGGKEERKETKLLEKNWHTESCECYLPPTRMTSSAQRMVIGLYVRSYACSRTNERKETLTMLSHALLPLLGCNNYQWRCRIVRQNIRQK